MYENVFLIFMGTTHAYFNEDVLEFFDVLLKFKKEIKDFPNALF